ncbi:coenzyme dependent N5,N10-methylene tetrahydromethanopterin reductase [Xylariomycetidae sp. FL2044]|nr:coenzyme dependent N5,N10-methylene tetrahydromethanopterin reductase [Xylariomycetidae sp. FL2044]
MTKRHQTTKVRDRYHSTYVALYIEYHVSVPWSASPSVTLSSPTHPASPDIEMTTPPKRIQLCLLELTCTGGYMASGQWKRPDDVSDKKDRLKYYMDLARLAERGKISAIFFADWYAGFDVYGGSLDACLRSGHQVAHMDPLPLVSAMATVTDTVAFAVTMSTSYANPYTLARQFSTLDHILEGRCAWNIVTSWSKGAAQALGHDDVIPHDERYAMADEYMDVVYKLWESSWAPDSVVWDKAADGVAFDPRKIQKIEHRGKYFRVSGRNQVHPSPQRTPVLFQAGASKTGSAFATKHAEAIFLNTASIAQAREVIAGARAQARQNGRDPASVKFFPCIVPYVGRTEAEGRAKYERARAHADPVAGLAQFSGYTGIDMAAYALDEEMDLSGSRQDLAIQSIFRGFAAAGERWTPRTLGLRMALGGLHPIPVGSAEQVADVFEAWVREADVDGFNVASVTNPGSWEDLVDLLVPELQRRGLFWEDYDVPGGTFRENLLGRKTLRDDHYGSRFKWGKQQEEAATPVVEGANGSTAVNGH